MGVPLGIPTRLNPHRIGTINCDQIKEVRDEPFLFNNDYKLVGGNPDHFVNGELAFPLLPQKPDGFYKSRHGPCFETNAVIYSKSDINMKYGMRRMLGSRFPDIPGRHHQMMDAQGDFINANRSFMEYIKSIYSPAFTEYLGAEEEMYRHYNDPHEKRQLRIQSHDEMIEDNTCCQCGNIWLRDVLWKIKPQEWAKFGKKPRCICDLGVSASLRGFILTNLLKYAQNDNPVHHLGGTFAFCKSPDPFELKRHFDLLRDPPGKFYFLYFSDDSCLSIRDEKGDVQWFNLDISSCDSSHSATLFRALCELMPTDSTQEDMKVLVKQCQSVLRVVSNGDKELKILLKPKKPVLMSGSTLTTAINNLANLLIGLSIVKSYVSAPVGVTNDTMVAAAARAGYVLTGCEALETFHDVQFLKHSPIEDAKGEWHPMLNLGVLYRASGTCNGDLPGLKSVSLSERARRFQRGLLKGAYPYSRFEILEEMVKAMGRGPETFSKSKSATDLQWKVTPGSGKYPVVDVPAENLIKRYRLEWWEYLELVEVARYDVGWYFNCSGASKVLKKDYGLETITSSDIQYAVGCEDEFGHTCSL